MKSRVRIILLCAIAIVTLGLCGCSGRVDASTMSKQQLEYELSKYDSNYEKILSVCTKEFCGNHPLDESFMGWFIGRYGENPLEAIVAREDFEDVNVWYNVTGKSIHVLWYEYCVATGINAYENQYTYVVNAMSNDSVVFDIAGDLSLAENKWTTNHMIENKNGLVDCFSDGVIDAINRSDVFIVNNEYAITEGGEPITAKYYYFRGRPDNINQLKRIGVDAVTIANNHVYDYGEEGFIDTLRNLEQYGMPYIGAGRNVDDAARPLYYIANGKKIAVVNATQIEKNQNFTKAATEDTAGVLKCLNPERFLEEIKQAKSNADYVLVISHWGTEYKAKYGSDQEKLAKQFVEAGADAVIGGHPHVLQGVDYIDDVPIYYSLGNFYFSLDEEMPNDYDTGIAQISINRDGTVDAAFIPCRFTEGTINLIEDGREVEGLYNELNSVSGHAELDHNGVITKK